MNWKTLTKTAKRTLSRNGSKILLGFGIAGAFTAVGFAITATPKAMILLDEKKKELGVEKLDAKTIVKTAAPVYIPTAISMAVSTGCIIGASSVNDRRNAALAAAYTMSETALRSYQDKVAATIGEDKAQEIKEAVTLEKMAKCPEPDEIPTAKNLAPDDVSYDKKVKCWESLSGKYFWTTRNAIEKALNGLNKQLLSDLSVTENDLYDYLGMEHCKNGDLLGWDTQSCMMVDTFYGSRVDEEGMRYKLNRELALAYILGDGRQAASEDKIDENCIRPIFNDADLFTIKVQVATTGLSKVEDKYKAFIKQVIRSRKEYRGSGTPAMFTTEDALTEMLLLEDGMGRPLYADEAALARKLRVSKIVTVPEMDGRKGAKGGDLAAVIVNLGDYTVGADKGGAVSMFDDFDIDYNAMKYLIETRCSAKRYSDKAKNVIVEAKSEYSGGYYKTYDLTALKGSWKKLSPVKGPYQYYCDIAVPDLTERHSPFCSTGLESYAAAVAAGLANAVETRNGALRLFAIRVPTKDIELVLTIFGVGTTSYELTLPVRDWVKMESAIGPNQYYCDVEVPGCLSTMTPLGTTALENFEAASPAGLASMIETCDGHVRFYAVRKPTANIDVIVALIKKEEPVNTPATRDKLGLVKIGDGMNVTSGGSISTRAATDSEFDAMMVRVFGEG